MSPTYPETMNIHRFVPSAQCRFSLVNTSPATPMMNGRVLGLIGSSSTGSMLKRESEAIAASALASLYSEAGLPSPLAYEQHIYHQMKNKQREEQELKGRNAKKFEVPERFTKNGRRRAVPFPLKLMKVLSDDRYSHIISWMPSGRSFVILRPKAFAADVLPTHFKSAQYASFTRKLSRWGFTRCEDGTGEFYHPLFCRGRLDLVDKMRCHGFSSKSEEAKKDNSKNVDTESRNDAEDASNSGDDATCASSVKSLKEQAPEDQSGVEPSQTSNTLRGKESLRMPPSRLELDLVENKERYLHLELEALRLRRCIRAAATSRKALAEMQHLHFGAGYMGSKCGNRAFALGAGGVFAELPAGSRGASSRVPWRSMMLADLMGTGPIGGSCDFDANPYSLRGTRRPNTPGAKSA